MRELSKCATELLDVNTTSSNVRYLLRIDDLCPTVDRQGWHALRNVLEEFQIRPILAVVPDNRDPALCASDPDGSFWSDIKRMEENGAAIGLHGFQHLCMENGRSLVPLHKSSEFAGASFDVQSERIARGLDVLRSHGLEPKLFIAPRHGFDRTTLRALRGEGLTYLSDGFARRPCIRGGITWIPQQLWAPILRSSGVWTVCLHPGSTGPKQVQELRAFFDKQAAVFTTFQAIIADDISAGVGICEWGYEHVSLGRALLRRRLKRLVAGS